MRILNVRNVHEALPRALQLLDNEGRLRDSRNGPVVLIEEPVTVVYERPTERVIFWADRDANPSLHLYEALWMLAGRNDIAPLARYTKTFLNYSDDGVTQHAAYGYRWRKHFGKDQLAIIIQRLRDDPTDRRSVLTMWDAQDLGRNGKDLACNLVATLSRNSAGALDLTVFQRSGDIIWGVLGANAVHMSLMQEYVALAIGCAVGSYHQVVSNFHAYIEQFDKLKYIRPDRVDFIDNPYIDRRVQPARMFHGSVEDADQRIASLLISTDTDFAHPLTYNDDEPFFNAAYTVLRAHAVWRTYVGEFRYLKALDVLNSADAKNDWVVAMREWIQRRYASWMMKQVVAGEKSHP